MTTALLPTTAAPARLRHPGWLGFWVVATVAVAAALVALPGLFAPADPYSLNVTGRFSSPSWEHLFGTDETGRDIFSRVIHGARYSIGSAFVVVVFGAAFGTLFGAIAGWAGGLLDRVMARALDVFLAFPYLIFAMAIAASLGRGLRSTVIALCLLWWPSYARMVRGQIKSILNDYHVTAARTLGATNSQILRWHVIPHTYDQLLVRFTLDIGHALVAFTGLSFLGLGASPPTPEWGKLVADAKPFALTAWWYAVLPGVVIVVFVLNVVLLGDALRKRASS